MKVDPIFLEVFKNRMVSVSEEMGVTLSRTAFSPNIKERKDLSCALFDHNGEMIAQAAHIPVHLGSMPLSVQTAISEIDFEQGDMVVLNDPYLGGTHLPDITVIAPVFESKFDIPLFYVANRAHHSDVGGMSSGSMPVSNSLYQEGIRIPPLKLLKRGEINSSLMDLVLSNVRTPEEREGDFSAQIMSNVTGINRLLELLSEYGREKVVHYSQALMDYSERIMRTTIAKIPDGECEFVDYMDDDGFGECDVPIGLLLCVNGENAYLDFSSTGDQVQGSINAVRSILVSAVMYVFRSLVTQDIPTNSGCLRPLSIYTRKGSLVEARFPAAVAGGNVETSQRIVDVVLGALSRAVPDRVPAASQGTMNNVSIGGECSDNSFSYYETIAGGMGASGISSGESTVHSHMTNTMNTPVEALECSYPLRVNKCSIRRYSGGTGKFKGGDGLIREIEALSPCEVTVLSERRKHSPYGLYGGSPGLKGENLFVGKNGAVRQMPGKFSINLQEGDRIRVLTPGGGGFGSGQKTDDGKSKDC